MQNPTTEDLALSVFESQYDAYLLTVRGLSRSTRSLLCLSKTSKCLSGGELYFFHNSLSRCSFFLRHSLPLCLRSCVRALRWGWRTWPSGTKSACFSAPQEGAPS